MYVNFDNFFPQRIHIPLSKCSLVLYFMSVAQTSYHLTNKPCGVLILPLFSHQCSTPWIFKEAIRTVETLRSPIRASCTERRARTNCGNSFSQLHCTYGWVCFNIKVCWGWFPSLPIFPPEITVYVPFSKRFYDLFSREVWLFSRTARLLLKKRYISLNRWAATVKLRPQARSCPLQTCLEWFPDCPLFPVQ